MYNECQCELSKSENFHETMYDVEILYQLVKKIQKEDKLVKQCKKYDLSLSDELDCDFVNRNIEKLGILKKNKVVSSILIKKIAKENITYDILKDALLKGGDEAVSMLLSDKSVITGKPRITENKKAINKIVQCV